MKTFYFGSLGFFFVLVLLVGRIGWAVEENEKEKTLTTISQFDLQRYMGKWYEIATIPTTFQRSCYGQAIAEYRIVLSEGLIEVINSCNKSNGEVDVIEARARVKESPAKLEVTFVKFITWLWWFAGDYWIIDLDDNYKYAVVGHPSLNYLWILYRNPEIEFETLNKLKNKIKDKGYNLCTIYLSPKAGELVPFSKRKRLCDL